MADSNDLSNCNTAILLVNYQIKWWDTRKLQNPTENLVIDLLKPEEQDVDRATGISALQFEPSMGTRFMCGLENGTKIHRRSIYLFFSV